MGIEFLSTDDDPEPREEPESGWKKSCTIADHRWGLDIEEGKVILKCLDPHPEEFVNEIDPYHGLPVCLDPYWVSEDLGGEIKEVHVEHVDDSTPSTPEGPAEYGYYIVIKDKEDAISGS